MNDCVWLQLSLETGAFDFAFGDRDDGKVAVEVLRGVDKVLGW
ncbi:MAG TPA: hypothetical protein VJH03_19275 [Blastocatellia bacterium]|nr:hypothetical protein [Blastocatellia bacterium]